VHATGAVLASLFEPWVQTGYVADLDRWQEAELAGGGRRDPGRARARGRECAARLLSKVGAASTDVATGPEGEPLWPQGWVGSISHRSALSIVAIARSSDALGLGVDIEPDVPCSTELVRRVCSDRELSSMAALGQPTEALARVVFSAKEALHKAQFPLTRAPSGLRHIEVLLDFDTFAARFIQPLAPFPEGFEVRGRWCKTAGLIWTGACFARAGSAA
jgi:4'-phosphopantetheinyl transferase EntD